MPKKRKTSKKSTSVFSDPVLSEAEATYGEVAKKKRDKFLDSVDIKESDIHKEFPEALKLLLADKTTGGNIIWATSDYEDRDDLPGFGLYKRGKADELVVEDIVGNFIKPRCVKSVAEQRSRTKERAEVFTPSWVCNKQNNLVDATWFGEKCVFNREKNKRWEGVHKTSKHHRRIVFPKGKTWQDYVKLVRMEVACGEAPYLVSRYDSAPPGRRRKPELIKIKHRIGLLDRKLRVVSENTSTPEEFFYWAKRAFKSTYAFEFQGDNLLLARENLLFSFYDYFYKKFKEAPSEKQMAKVAEIIAWNIFQMDALTQTVPEFPKEKDSTSATKAEFHLEQEDLSTNAPQKPEPKWCKIKNWEPSEIFFKDILKNESPNR